MAGDRLAEALRLYDDAMYTRALDVLDAIALEQPTAAVHQYRALCLIALGRGLLPPLIRRGFAEATARYREGATARAREQFDQVLKLLDDPALQNDQALSDLALVASAFVELTRAQTPPPPIESIVKPVVAAPLPPSLPAAPAGPEPAPPAAVPTAVASTAPAPMRVTASEPVAYEPAVAVVRPLPKWMPPDAYTAQRKYTG